MSTYNEDAYENALIELFQNMSWEYVYGPDIDRDWHLGNLSPALTLSDFYVASFEICG